ncbi:unnamed protein product [Phaedon cochleariae]|uniref:long-chain-fatty-acid--CoA ligase n=1 Tax=Phaedon cochleariae TaxID=80249 RepID=A0A9P0GR91_PHACE|nr:unnamed protein product [Phaedon cochleariae]
MVMNFLSWGTFDCGQIVLLNALKILAVIYDVVTLPVYLIIQNPWKARRLNSMKKAIPIDQDDKSITIKATKKPGRFHIELEEAKIDTMAKLLNYAQQKHGDKQCLGTREILREEDEIQQDGKVFKKYIMGDYQWKSFNEVNDEALRFGRGLREMGNEPGKNVVILAETRAEWMIAAHALFKQTIPLVTVYATLGEDGIIHAFNETEVTTVITSFSLLAKLKNILPSTPRVGTVIYMEDQLESLKTTEGFSDGVKIVSFGHVLNLGAKSTIEDRSPTPEDTAIIMYTSGSTGIPKGVRLVHRNMITSVKGFADSTEMYERTEVVLGYLPLAHVFELLVENGVIFMGIRIGYSSALTMLDSSSKIKRGVPGDVSVLQPTFMTSVPLILDRISKSINEKVAKSSAIKRTIFNFAFEYKLRWKQLGFSTPLIDRVVFGPVKKIMGGRLRLIAAGGAPLTPETNKIVKMCLCTDIIAGYGLTETTSCATNQDTFDLSFGRAGAPMTIAKIMLVNWEQGNYFITDEPNPRGEIMVGGDNVSPGYYKLPDKTNEDFFEHKGCRWFRTGDIGEIHHDGIVKIIDRKKDLVKLQAGEYVSLGKVESQLSTCPLVESICVMGNSSKNSCVALVVPHHDNLLALAAQKGIRAGVVDVLCKDSRMLDAVLEEISGHGLKGKLEKFEIPTRITLLPQPWTPETGLVTATFKLKRKAIQDYYENEIENMYASLD